ncbi:MAG: DUF4129 domain-containing protein [Planctomycetia bacterium]
MTRRLTIACVAAVGLTLVGGASAAAWQVKEAAPNDPAGASLRREAFPWYDAAKNAYRPLPPEEAKSNEPCCDWMPADFASTIGRFLVYVLIGVVLAFLIVTLLRSFDFMKGRSTKSMDPPSPVEAPRVEALPMRARPVDDLLTEAERLYAAGDLAEAVVYLYAHQLMSLDKAGAVRLKPGKTNRDYLRETQRSAAAVAPILKTTIRLFEDSFFGGLPVERTAFEGVWSRRQSFAAAVARAVAETAP